MSTAPPRTRNGLASCGARGPRAGSVHPSDGVLDSWTAPQSRPERPWSRSALSWMVGLAIRVADTARAVAGRGDQRRTSTAWADRADSGPRPHRPSSAPSPSPPLGYLPHGWRQRLGDARALIIAVVLLIAAVYWLGVEVYDRRTGLVAASLATLAPILVWYSQEARGYELEALFSTLAVVGCVRVIKRGSSWDWALYTVAADSRSGRTGSRSS